MTLFLFFYILLSNSFFCAFYFFFKYHSFYLISFLLIIFLTFYHFGKICFHSEFSFFNFLVQATIILTEETAMTGYIDDAMASDLEC